VRVLSGEDAHFLMKNPHHQRGDADFDGLGLSKAQNLFQSSAHSGCLTTCSQMNEVNTSCNAVEVQYVVELTCCEVAQIIVDDLLTYQVVNNN
jgi:hypothetical protein